MKLNPTPRVRAPKLRHLKSFALLAGVATLGGCAQQQSVEHQQPRTRIERSSTEYFPEGRFGRASPRMVSDDSPVPRGGGKYLVGKPYMIAGKRYYPTETPHQSQTGMASYYGGAFHGRKTANGEIFDMTSITAAHPTMPLPSYARVTNTANGRSMIVRVNDRGPYHGGRVLDVSQRVAESLDFKRAGTARIRVDYVGRAGIGGSDDRKLMATLRTDGQPASLDGVPTNAGPTLIARDEPSAPQRPAPQRIAVAQPEPRAQEFRQEFRAVPTPVAANTTSLQPVIAQATAPVTAQATASAPVTAFAAAPIALPQRAPLPPSRPFDLGTIPGAGVPIAAARPTAALNYAPAESRLTRFLRRDPFIHVDASAARPLNGRESR